MTIPKRLAWCALNAFASLMGLMIVTGLYDNLVAYPLSGFWIDPVFRYGSRFDTLTWLHVMAAVVALSAVAITWWRTGRSR